MEYTHRVTKVTGITALLFLVAACGGGGGSDGSAAASPPPTAAPPSAPVNTITPTPVYPDAVRTAAFDTINSERLKAGLGALTQSTELDTAGGYDSNYILLNPTLPPSYIEDAGNPGYVSDNSPERLEFAGYSASAFNLVFSTGMISGTDAAEAMLATPYHRVVMMDYTWTQMGFGFNADANGEGALVSYVAIPTGGTAQGMSSTVSVYPVDKSTGVSVLMPNEQPLYPLTTPWGPGAYPGYPVSVQLNKADIWTPGTFTLAETSSGASVSGTVLDSTSHALQVYGIKNWAFFVPTTPLKPNTSYTATFTATVQAEAFSKTWSFTTRPATVTLSNVPTAPVAAATGATVNVQSTSLDQALVSATVNSQCGGATPVVVVSPGAVNVKLSGSISSGCAATVTVNDVAYPNETASFTLTFTP